MASFMRLIDRKYPHAGRYFNLKRFGSQPWTKLQNKDTTAFFAAFSDKEFLTKPILKPDQEVLYEGGNVDFAAKYRLRFAPYIFEPTYADDYVYGCREK
jgi:hypothetical protein